MGKARRGILSDADTLACYRQGETKAALAYREGVTVAAIDQRLNRARNAERQGPFGGLLRAVENLERMEARR